MSGNKKLWLGLIWTLIDRYQIKTGHRRVSTKQAMLAWVNGLIPHLEIKNFSTDWNNGIALCALIDAIRPGLCPNHASLNPKTGLTNCELGMELAEKHLNIPPLLDPADLNNPIVDDLSVMTYLSYFTENANEALLRWIQEKIPEQQVENFGTDWNNGIALSALVDAMNPGLLPRYKDLKATQALDNVKRAMAIAEDRMGVDKTLEPSEITDPKVDQTALAAYLMQFQHATLKAAPGQCATDGGGLQSAIVNQRAEFKLDASRAGEGRPQISVTGPKTSPGVEISQSKPHIYTVSYTPKEVGVHRVDVNFEGQPVPKSPFKVPVVNPNACHVTGSGIGQEGCMIGKPLEFIVNTENAGPGQLATALFGPTGSLPLSTAEKDGKGTFSATPSMAGNYSLEIKWSGFSVPGSPFSLRVSDPLKCQLLINTKQDQLEKVGVPVEITVDTRQAGSGNLTAVAKGPSRTVHLQAEEADDSTRTIIFIPGEAGVNDVSVYWNGTEIPRSPLCMNVVDPSLCFFEQVPSYAQVAKEVNLRLLTQQNISAPLQVKAQNETGGLVACTVVPKGSASDGVFDIKFKPSQVGTLEVDANWAGDQVPQCPFDIKVCDASKCSAYGPGLLKEGGKLGEPVQFTVQAKDAGDGALVVRPRGQKTTNSASIRDNGDGTYDVTFTPWEVGPHEIDVEWGGAPLPSSPYHVDIQGRVMLSQLTASGEGLKEALVLSPTEFQLSAGEPGLTEEGQLQVEVQAVQDEAAVDITDSGDGNYTITYVAPSSGQYLINVLYGGEHMPGSPFRSIVQPRPDATKCEVTGLEADAQHVAGDPIEVSVSTKDAGHGVLKVTARGPGDKQARVFMAKDDTEHSIRIDTGLPGKYTVNVLWSNEPVTGSPFQVNVSSRLTPQQMQVRTRI